MLYGFNGPRAAGADLRFTPERPYNAVVSEAVASEIETLKKKFASGDLKLSVTREDARGGT